jgi:hypothetical protein
MVVTMELTRARKRLIALKTRRQAVEQAIDALGRVEAAYRKVAASSATRTVREAPRSRGLGGGFAAGRHDDH